jgi:hypothetical protein
MKFHRIMTAELKVDCYDGPNSDRLRPYWQTFAEGNKDADTQEDPLKLDRRHFPPGTIVTVEVPCCPQCGIPNDVEFPITVRKKPKLREKCECGFDWQAWIVNEYS